MKNIWNFWELIFGGIFEKGKFRTLKEKYPDMDEDDIEALMDGADINGDGDINYVAYVKLVCRQILRIDSTPLQERI